MSMPDWLLKDEKYVPEIDKESFLNKSILTFLNLLSRIKAQSNNISGILQVNAILKVIFTVLLVVMLSISGSMVFIILVNVYLLFVLSSMRAGDIIKVLRVSFVIALFTFIVLLPAFLMGNYHSMIYLTPKVFATVTAVNILSYTTPWRLVTSALKVFFVPDIFILVLDITLKYIVMLGEFTLEMLYSLKLRSVGRNKRKYTSISGIAGTMFIKSKEMAEDMYAAMECRGFTGEYRVTGKLKLSFADGIFILINVIIILTFIYLGRY